MIRVIVSSVLLLFIAALGQVDTAKAAKPKKARKAAAHVRTAPDSIQLSEMQAKADLDFDMGNLDTALANYLTIRTLDAKIRKNDAKIGKIYLGKKDYARAEKYLAGAAEGNADAMRMLAECHVALKKGKKAIEDYQKVMKLRTDDAASAKALYLLCEEQKADNQTLVQAYKTYLYLAPDDNSVHLKCAYASMKSSDPVIREEGFLKIMELRPKDTPVMLELAKFYMSRQQNDKAVPVLEKADSAEPGNLEVLRLIAMAYGSTGKKKQMAAVLEKQFPLEKQAPVKEELHRRLGDLYAELKETKKAVSHYEAYIQARPKDIDVQKALLAYYREEKNREKEVIALSALIKLEPNKIAHWQTRADMEFDAGNKDSAMAQYLAIKNMDPDYAVNDLKIGRMYHAKKEWLKAEKYLSTSAGSDPETLKMLADCYLNLKKGTQAIEIYQRLFKEKPTDKDLARKIYKMCEQTIVGNAALLKAYQDYLTLVPADTIVGAKVDHTLRIMKDVKDIEAYQSRGDLYFSIGDSLCALRDYLSVYRINMQVAANDTRIAVVSYAMKDYATAEKFLVRSAGSNPEAIKMLEDCRKQLKKGKK